MASGPITACQTEGEEVEVVTDFLFLGSKITEDRDCGQEIILLNTPGKNSSPCLSQRLKAEHFPRLMVPFLHLQS